MSVKSLKNGLEEAHFYKVVNTYFSEHLLKALDTFECALNSFKTTCPDRAVQNTQNGSKISDENLSTAKSKYSAGLVMNDIDYCTRKLNMVCGGALACDCASFIARPAIYLDLAERKFLSEILLPFWVFCAALLQHVVLKLYNFDMCYSSKENLNARNVRKI